MRSKHNNPISATLKGIIDVFRPGGGRFGRLGPEERIDGKVCLVTGANSGLGKAIAAGLAARGGRVIMACRTMNEGAREEIVRRSGNPAVSMRHIDLGDLTVVEGFCDSLAAEGVVLDRVVLNAGMVAGRSRPTVQGFEQVVGVTYVGNFALVNGLLGRGVLPGAPGDAAASDHAPPRLVIVSSEAHRWPRGIDLSRLERRTEYRLSGALTQYAYSKFYLTAFFAELVRRLGPATAPKVGVHALCPGAVNTRIAREAPSWTQPLVRLVFSLFFRSPVQAAEPALYLSCARTLERVSGVYLHVMTRKSIDPRAEAPSFGGMLWERTTTLIARGGGDDDGAREAAR